MTNEVERLVDVLENMARQHCFQDASKLVDSRNLKANASTLRLLHAYARFLIVEDSGRFVTGYWPDDMRFTDTV